jgi:hypothetical protein
MFPGRFALARSEQNLVTNTEWLGGNTPTGWANSGTTGTRTAGDSIYHPGHKSLRFQCSTTRAHTSFTVALPVGNYYTMRATLETAATPVAWNALFAGGVSYGYYVNSVLVTTAGGTTVAAAVGDRLSFVFFSGSAVTLCAWGIGASGNDATGDMTLSRPRLFAGRKP